MPVMKRATKQLADMGLPDLEVRKGIYGYYVFNRTLRKQHGTPVRKTPGSAVQDIRDGKRPQPFE